MNMELMAKTQVFTTVESLKNHLLIAGKNQRVGFVPTMGALHQGHLSLVERAMQDCNIVVVSIFVNPTQFNNSEDLINYPRTFDADIEFLESFGEIVVFAPGVKEMYPEDHTPKRMNLGLMGSVMEGKFREGHFDGVVEVVYRLFDIVQPNHAYFGEKDFQQLAVIRKMVREFDMGIDIIGCSTYRESGGLAASSRNQRLSNSEKIDALLINQAMIRVKDRKQELNPKAAVAFIESLFEESPLYLEYISFVDSDTFEEVDAWTDNTRACIAAVCGPVRLIDNMSMA